MPSMREGNQDVPGFVNVGNPDSESSCSPHASDKITPFKLVLVLMIRDYIGMNKCKTSPETSLTPFQRSRFSLLLLSLIQGPDKSPKALNEEWDTCSLPPNLFHEWKGNLSGILISGVEGLCDIPKSLQSLMSSSFSERGSLSSSPLHRSSVIGLYFRRFLLSFELLSFSQISSLYLVFKTYSRALFDEDETLDLESSSLTEEISDYTHNHSLRYFESSEFFEQTHSELYIAKQVELLESVPHQAERPKALQNNISNILDTNPHLSAAHFLSYLNALRVNEHNGSLSSLYEAFAGHKSLSTDEIHRSYRYAALNLAALHLRFSHTFEASCCLKEAIMLSQESSDHVCLQHALSWLYRLQSSSSSSTSSSSNNNNDNYESQFISNESKNLLSRCISNSSDLSLSYLTSLGIQCLSYTQIFSLYPSSAPQYVLETLKQSDVLNTQHSLLELLSSSLALKSAFWATYGRSHLSSYLSQLLLNLDTSDPLRDGYVLVSEPFALSLSNLARSCYTLGFSSASEKIVNLAKQLFPRHISSLERIWKSTTLHIEFQKSLHQSNWISCERFIIELSALQENEALFLSFELELERRDAWKAFQCWKALKKCQEKVKFSVLEIVWLYILQGELYCMTDSFSSAIKPFSNAANLCQKYHLEFIDAIVNLHLGHIQLQLGMAENSVQIVKRQLPFILSHGNVYEVSKAYLLYAKCLTANSGRKNVNSISPCPIQYLKLAHEGFAALESHHRCKDVLYMLARLYHARGNVQERNQASADFKKLCEISPNNTSSKLANML